MADLQKWLREQEPEGFARSEKDLYLKRLENLQIHLEKEVFPHVDKGALLHRDGYLTDHGKGHIETVIRRAGRLLGENICFSAYEVYLLLVAIFLHDAGNIFGREEHERRVSRIVTELGSLLGEDTPEKRMISNIAAAHGGRINGSKDTIGNLLRHVHILGKQVRVQALAALLRFADELADDSTRAARFPQRLGQVPKKSEIYQ